MKKKTTKQRKAGPVEKLFRTKAQWTQRQYARFADQSMANSSDPGAVCWCLMGAINRCYSEKGFGKAYNAVYKAIYGKGKVSDEKGIVIWNDVSTRTFEEVLAVVKKANV